MARWLWSRGNKRVSCWPRLTSWESWFPALPRRLQDTDEKAVLRPAAHPLLLSLRRDPVSLSCKWCMVLSVGLGREGRALPVCRVSAGRTTWPPLQTFAGIAVRDWKANSRKSLCEEAVWGVWPVGRGRFSSPSTLPW